MRTVRIACEIGLLGGVMLIALSLFGVGALLATSSELFQVVKWVGVLYMSYLGISQIAEARRHGKAEVPEPKRYSGLASTRAGFFTAVLNPKAIIFIFHNSRSSNNMKSFSNIFCFWK